MKHHMAEITDTKDMTDHPINIHKLIEFLEYEEALTNDKETKVRIRLLLVKIGIWEK